MRLRLDLGYDGSDFAGWARQPGLRTVQGVIEAALATVLRSDDEPRLVVAGRTDAKVHARGQVAHLDISTELLAGLRSRDGADHAEVLNRRLAGVLPSDVVIGAISYAPVGFDARFSAQARRYAYRVCDAQQCRDPLTRASVLWYPRVVDVDAMSEAANDLVGLHDFAAFCKPRAGATTIRTLKSFRWSRKDGVVTADLEADAFCHSMVRAMVGGCLAVGDGRRDRAWLAEQLRSGRRGAVVAPPHGLTLEEVLYPPDEQLAQRAVQTRARREVSGDL